MATFVEVGSLNLNLKYRDAQPWWSRAVKNGMNRGIILHGAIYDGRQNMPKEPYKITNLNARNKAQPEAKTRFFAQLRYIFVPTTPTSGP